MIFLQIIRGLPGSGKSTFAKKFADIAKILHVEADQYFMTDGVYQFDKDKLHQAHLYCQKTTFEELSKGNSVVVSNTFTTLSELKPYIEFAQNLGIDVNITEMKNDFGNIHNVPNDTINRMKERFAPPYEVLKNKTVKSYTTIQFNT